MSYQELNIGTIVNDGQGDTLPVAGDKINDNFVEIYTLLGNGTVLSSGISATATVVTLTAPTISGVVGGTITSATITTLTGTTFNAGTLALAAGSITDSSGAISFGNENLTTTGSVTAASLDISGNVDIDGTLETDALTIDGVSLAETISDTVGAMVSSNTETNITVTYDDADNTLDFVIGTLNQSTSGNAGTATALETARTIHGVSFDGTANIDLTEVVQDTVGAMFSSNTETNITATYQDSDGTIDLVIGTLNQDTTGNAATATALETARTIGGTSFDGTANIAVALSATATALANARTIHGVSFDGTANIDLTEVVQDTVGAMFGSNTETGITATYQDSDGTIDLVIGTLNQDTTGTAAVATVATTVTITDNESTNENNAIVFTAGGDVDGGNLGLESDGTLTYNPSTGKITATGFVGVLTGDVTGDVTGNADTATALATARTIHGVSFDGSANIDLTEVVQDTVGAMFGSNTETGITVTYQDADGTIDLVVGTLNQDTTGTAAKVTVTDSTANTNFPVTFHDESNALLDDTGALRYNPSTGTLLVPNLVVAGTTTQVDTVTMNAENAVIFEGATADDHETTLTIIDPTADRTQRLLNQSGFIPLLAAVTTTAITSTPEELNILDGATVVVGEINALDLGSTAVGTAIASKAVILDSNKDYTGIRNFTVSGELDAATGDFSGDVDVDGTLEADAITVNGTALNEFISDTVGAMVGSNTETGITVTYQDSDNTIDFALAAAQTTITSLLATDIKIGEDDQTKIDFETADEIHFYAANAHQIKLVDGALVPATDNDVDLGTSSAEFKDAYFDGTVTADAFAGPINGDLTGTLQTAAQANVTSLGTLTTLTVDNIIINGTNIGHTSDTDSIAIASDGVVTFSQAPVFPDGSIAVADLDIDGATDIGADIVDADLFIIDDGAGGTNRKTTAARIKAYIAASATALDDIGAGDGAVTLTTSSGNITIDAAANDSDIILKGTDGGADLVFVTIDGSAAGKTTFNDGIVTGAVITSGAGLVIADDGNIGSASDTDSIAIAADGVVTFSQAPVFPDGSLNIADIDLDGGTDIGANLADADLFLVDDGGGGTMRKMAASRLKTYISASTAATAADDIAAGDGAVNITTSSGNITIDAAANDSDIILKGTDGGADTDFLTIDGSAAGKATFNNEIVSGAVITSGAGLIIADAGTIGSASDTDAIAIGSDGDVTLTQDLELQHDGAILSFGANDDVTVTHVHNTGLLLNAAMVMQFRDSAINIGSPADGDLDINADDEIELNSTLIDINGAVDISGATTVGGILKTDDATEATSTTDGSLQTDGGLSVVKDIVAGDDIKLLSDAAVVAFGANSEITLTHVHDVGLTVTNTINGTDNRPTVLQLKSEEDAIVADDVIASIEMAAGDSDGTDGATVAAGIHAIAEDTFSASANKTKLVFTTGVSETAASSATAKMTLSSAGLLTIADDFVIKDGGTIGVASDADSITIASDGVVTFSQEIVAPSLDISGNVDIDGTLEADAITVNGTALAETISDTVGAMVGSNTETGISVTYQDGDNTIDFALAAAQTTITSLLATDIKIGEDDQTKIDFETADEIHFYANNANEMIVQANVVAPGADDGTALGDANQRWSDLFLASGAVVNFDNGDVTATHSSNTLTIAGGTLATAALTTSTIVASGIIKTDDSTEATSTTDGSLQTDGGLSVVKDIVAGDDIKLLSDAAVIHFGANSEITATHVHNVGLTLTHTATGDNTPMVLQLKSEEDAIVANEVIGSLEFAAGDSDGTDGATVAAGIHAIAEGTFSASANATKLVFTTGVSETAASSATAKMTLSSAGLLTIADDFVIKDGGTIGVASDADSITIASDGVVTFSQEIVAPSLDISGNVDIDGTLEADAITVNGTALAETISDTVGAMVGSNTETGIAVTYQDGDNTIDFAINAAQTTITSLLATDIKIGEDDQTKIDFETADEIHFYAANAHQIKLVDGALVPVTDNDVDLGTSSLEFKDAFFDGTVTSDAFAGPLTGDVTGTSSKVTVTNSTANTNFPVVFHDESDSLLDDTGALRYNPSSGTLLVPNLVVAGTTTQVDTVTMNAENAVVFEGATADDHETTLTIIDPTGDRTINLPNVSGTIPVLAAASTTQITSTPAELNILDGATVVVGEINALDLGSTAVGTAIASKAVILDSNKDYSGIRNLTISGEIDAATGDFSGAVDVAGATTTAAITASGIIKTDDATEATSTTDGSLQTDGGLSVVKDIVAGDDIKLLSDAAVIHFGTNSEITATHVHNVGLTLTHTATGDNTPMVLQLKSEEDAIVANEVIASLEFAAGDSDGTDGATVAAGIHAIAEGTFSASANATKLVFTTGVSETAASSATAKMTLSSAGLLTIADDFVIKDGGTIGVASDADSIAIASDGVVTFSQAPVFPDGSIAVADLDIDGATDIGAAIVDADLFIIDDGAGGTNRKTTAARIKTYTNAGVSSAADDISAGDAAVTITTSSGNITIDAAANDSDIILKGTDGGADTDFLTIDGSAAGKATFNNEIVSGAVITSGAGLVIADAGTIGSASDTDAIAIGSDGDVTLTQDLELQHDGAILSFGANDEVTLTHVHNDGLLLNADMQLQFRDSAINIRSDADGDLDINADDEIELNSTLIDINGAVDISGATTVGGILKTDDATEATSTTDGSLQTDGGLSVVKDAVFGDDVKLLSDAAVISFGANSEITATHVHNVGLTLTHTATGDNTPMVLQLKSEEDAIVANEVIGSLEFAAGDSDGTDGATVAAGIHAIAEGTFSASANATKLVFTTGVSETAASSATAKMTLSSAGLLTIADDFVIKDGGTIGSASDADAIAIGSDGDVTLTQDLELQHDGAILSFGANDDVTLTHVHNTGLILNAAMVMQFRDSAINIGSPADGDLDINADDEIELNSTLIDVNGNLDVSGTGVIAGHASIGASAVDSTRALTVAGATDGSGSSIFVAYNSSLAAKFSIRDDGLVDLNGNLDVSGTYTGGGLMTTGGNIVIPNTGNIGSVSDTDAIAIAANGVVTFSQAPVFPDGSIALADLDIDGGTDIGAAIVDADLFIVDDGAGGTNRKTTAARLKTYIDAASAPVQMIIKDASGVAIRARTGLNSSGGTTAEIINSAGSTLLTLIGPFVDGIPEIVTPTGNVIMDASAADTDVGDEILLEDNNKVNLEHAAQI